MELVLISGSIPVQLHGWESLIPPGWDTNPSQVIAGTQLPTPEGWKAELA